MPDADPANTPTPDDAPVGRPTPADLAPTVGRPTPDADDRAPGGPAFPNPFRNGPQQRRRFPQRLRLPLPRPPAEDDDDLLEDDDDRLDDREDNRPGIGIGGGGIGGGIGGGGIGIGSDNPFAQNPASPANALFRPTPHGLRNGFGRNPFPIVPIVPAVTADNAFFHDTDSTGDDTSGRADPVTVLTARRDRAAARLAGLGYWEWDLRTDRIHWTNEVFRLFGRVPDDGVPPVEEFREQIPQPDRTELLRAYDRARTSGVPFRILHRITRPTFGNNHGSVLYVQSYGDAIRDDAGNIIAVGGAIMDFTQQQERIHAAAQMAETLRERERQAQESEARATRTLRELREVTARARCLLWRAVVREAIGDSTLIPGSPESFRTLPALAPDADAIAPDADAIAPDADAIAPVALGWTPPVGDEFQMRPPPAGDPTPVPTRVFWEVEPILDVESALDFLPLSIADGQSFADALMAARAPFAHERAQMDINANIALREALTRVPEIPRLREAHEALRIKVRDAPDAWRQAYDPPTAEQTEAAADLPPRVVSTYSHTFRVRRADGRVRWLREAVEVELMETLAHAEYARGLGARRAHAFGPVRRGFGPMTYPNTAERFITRWHLIGVCTDVTEMVETSQALERQSREVLARSTESAARGEELAARSVELSQKSAALEQMTAELSARSAELSRSNEALTEFASVASHDLQEPLRKVQTLGDLLRRRLEKIAAGNTAAAAGNTTAAAGNTTAAAGNTAAAGVDPQAADYLARMQSAARRMQSLITDLLTYSRVTTQARPFTPVSLRRLVGDVLEDLEAQIARTGGRVVWESEAGNAPPEAEMPSDAEMPPVFADARQIRSLLQNLISNALKYHRPGVPPVVRLSWRIGGGDDGDDDALELRVSDNGIGFEMQHAERIFQVFERLDERAADAETGTPGSTATAATVEGRAGTGIGLAICRKICERHGGAVFVETSVPGAGTVLVARLPLLGPGAGAGAGE